MCFLFPAPAAPATGSLSALRYVQQAALTCMCSQPFLCLPSHQRKQGAPVACACSLWQPVSCQLIKTGTERERVRPTLGGWRGSRAVTGVPRGPNPLLLNITSLFQPSRAAVRHLQVPSHSHSTHTRCNTARPSEMNSATPTRSACHINCCIVAHPSNRCGHRPRKACRAAHSKTSWCSSHT